MTHADPNVYSPRPLCAVCGHAERRHNFRPVMLYNSRRRARVGTTAYPKATCRVRVGPGAKLCPCEKFIPDPA